MPNLTIRNEVSLLSPDDLAALRDAYSKMQARSDNQGWIYWNSIHGFDQYKCWHHGREGFGSQKPYNLFLPWHRAYLLNFENAMKDQNGGAALSWWDWTSDESHANGLPQAFSENIAGGNPLQSGPMPAMGNDPARQTERTPGDPGELPTTDDVNQLMTLTSFLDLTSQIENIHDGVHGWVGGDMGIVAQAAFDPIFWAHHTMIDRIWYLWQLRQGSNNIPQEYLDKPLEPFSLKVSDVLDISNLGYTYATTAVTVPVGG